MRLINYITISLLISTVISIPDTVNAWQYVFRNRGEQRDDGFGLQILGVGDQNQDGFDDILAYHYRLGEFQLFYGGNPMDTIPDWRLHTGDYNGVHNYGDLNGDEIPDLGFAIRVDNVRHHYVFWGGDLDTIPDLEFNGNGAIEAGGDVNGDGYNDLFFRWIGWDGIDHQRGIVQLFLGGEEGPDTIPDWQVTGDWWRARLGSGFNSRIDLNHDGYDDFWFSNRIEEDPDRDCYNIYFGGEDLDTIPDLQLDPREGIDDYDCGYSLIPLDDLNGDGYDDYFVNLSTEDHIPGIMFGRENFELHVDLRINPGFEYGSFFPASVGDVNGDGYNDLFIGDPMGVGGLGKITLYLGGPWMEGDYVLTLNGWERSFYVPVGRRVGWCGDVNGDGLNDLMFSNVGDGVDYSLGEVCIIGGSEEWEMGVDHSYEGSEAVSCFILEELYPNPFNSQLQIEISVLQSCRINAQVYDIEGKYVDTIVNKRFSTGSTTLTWKAESIPAGIYFIRFLSPETTSQFAKILLIK